MAVITDLVTWMRRILAKFPCGTWEPGNCAYCYCPFWMRLLCSPSSIPLRFDCGGNPASSPYRAKGGMPPPGRIADGCI
ncbi:MAG: hypothetical protein JZU65_06350 [Chlorobium sp.]|nr:hypothetical protein [Chlorobium sp.]